MFPKKRVKKPPPKFRYPHELQVGDLLLKKYRNLYSPGGMAIIIEFFDENGHECVKVFFQDTQQMQVLTLARLMGLYEKAEA